MAYGFFRGLYFPDRTKEETFHSIQQSYQSKNFVSGILAAFLFHLFSSFGSLINVKNSGDLAYISVVTAYFLIVVPLCFKFGSLKKIVIIILDFAFLYYLIHNSTLINEQGKSLQAGFLKIIFTLISSSCTNNCLVKICGIILSILATAILFKGSCFDFSDDFLSHNVIFFLIVLGYIFYNEEKEKRDLFSRYYNQLKNVDRWKFILEKLIPAGYIIASSTKAPGKKDVQKILKILSYNDFFKINFDIKDPGGVSFLLKNLPVINLKTGQDGPIYWPGNDKGVFSTVETLLLEKLDAIERNSAKIWNIDYSHMDDVNCSTKINCKGKFDPSEIEEKNFSISVFDFFWDESPCILITFKDLSEKRKNEKLQALHKYKDLLMASVSHELKTPLNSIMGTASYLLSREFNDPETMKYLNHIKISGDFLLSEINDILDFSQISKGKLRLVITRFELDEIFEHLKQLFSMQMEEKGLLFSCHLSVYNSLLYTDFHRLKQILINLISNSLKFTFKGSISLTATDFDNEKIIIAVRDSGTGMSPEVKANLFQVFGTFDESKQHLNRQGIGLGLFISKQLVGKLGPEELINVESQLGKGSEFSFIIFRDLRENIISRKDINIITSKKEVESGKLHKPALPYSIDDSRYLSPLIDKKDRVIKKRLRKGFWSCLSIGHRSKPKHIFIPLKNEKNTGISLKAIPTVERQQPRKSTKTNSYSPSFLNKKHHSCSIKSSTEIKESYNCSINIPRSNNQATGGIITLENDNQVFNVLIVDDDLFNIVILENFLHQCLGKKVKTKRAFNGQECIDSFSLNKKPYDIVLLDCNMPVMDGFEACSILKSKMKSGEIPNCPIVGVTAFSGVFIESKCIECEMDDFITKPMTKEKFLEFFFKWTIK